MKIEQWDFSASVPLVDLYNEHAIEIPYDYPIDQAAFVEAIRPLESLNEEELFVAIDSGSPKGYIQVGIIAHSDSSEKIGLVRFLLFPHNHRAVGQALLDRAHNYLRTLGALTYQAFNYNFSYPCTWYGHLKVRGYIFMLYLEAMDIM